MCRSDGILSRSACFGSCYLSGMWKCNRLWNYPEICEKRKKFPICPIFPYRLYADNSWVWHFPVHNVTYVSPLLRGFFVPNYFGI